MLLATKVNVDEVPKTPTLRAVTRSFKPKRSSPLDDLHVGGIAACRLNATIIGSRQGSFSGTRDDELVEREPVSQRPLHAAIRSRTTIGRSGKARGST
jgi:hypothetical protein